MAQITYADKVKLNDIPSIPAENKVRDVDMNEIKSVVNGNYDEFETSTKFSSTEKAIGVDDDGNTVYRKTIDFTTSNSLDTFVQISGISGIDTPFKYSGYILSGTQKFLLPFTSWDAGSGIARSIWFYVDTSGNLYEAHNHSAQSGKSCHLVLEYTKL